MGSSLDSKQVDTICRKVYKRYPAVDGARPQIQKQDTGSGDRFVLVFKGRVKMDDGAFMTTVVRVTTDAEGNILKFTTSR